MDQIFSQWVVPLGTVTTVLGTAFFFVIKKVVTAMFNRVEGEFNKQTETHLENLRFRIDRELDRSRQSREYVNAHLPLLWGQIHDAYHEALNALNPVQTQLDLTRATEEEFEFYLNDIEAPDPVRRAIRDADNPNQELSAFLDRKRVNTALRASGRAHRALHREGVILTSDLYRRCSAFLTLIFEAVDEKRIGEELGLTGPDYNKKRTRFRNQHKQLHGELLESMRAYVVG